MADTNTKIPIRALGQTIERNGEVSLIAQGLPNDCMVLFVDMDTWDKIKDRIELQK